MSFQWLNHVEKLLFSMSDTTFPSDYKDVQVQHLGLLYGLYYAFSATGIGATLSNKLVQYTSKLSDVLLPLVYTGCIPDPLLRFGIRIRLHDQLQELRSTSIENDMIQKQVIVQELHTMPIAIATADANQQHYEVPTSFYDLCLGPQKKYSSGYWKASDTTFEESETDMLAMYCERAGVVDGMHIVDLGCGWGSLTLYLAKHYPNCKITSISNSNSQREYIYKHAELRCHNVKNITIITVR